MHKKSLLFITVFSLLASYTTTAQIASANTVVVKTEAGKVQGQLSNGIAIFKNILFALSNE